MFSLLGTSGFPAAYLTERWFSDKLRKTGGSACGKMRGAGDVGRWNLKERLIRMEQLSNLPNLGKVVEEQLIRAGVKTPAQLRELGSRKAWLKIQQIDASACINRLYSLEGAIRNIKKADLPPEVKAELKAFYETHKI